MRSCSYLLAAAALLRPSGAAMGPLMQDVTLLDGCALNPGQSSACASDRGVLPSAAACAAACDLLPACSGATYHGPSTQQWAGHCVFRLDGVYDPRACGSGCDHTSSNKTSGWVPAAPVLPVWGPSLLPWGKPKVFWFGANASGLDSEPQLALEARHAVAGNGWQTGHPGGGTVGLGEMWQAAASTHLADYLDAVGNNSTMVFQYRQVQVALRLFGINAIAADDASKADFWLHDESGVLCLAGQPWGTQDPYWNFSSAAAADYWVQEVIGGLTRDASLTSGRGAVFWDESDQGECGYRSGNCDFSKFNSTALQAAKNAVYARQTQAMNAAGIIPIFSLDNRLNNSSAGLDAPLPCALPEDDLAAALKGQVWVRFYENFPRTFWAGGKDLEAAMVANAIAEAALGIPNVLHSGGACPAPARNITRPGPLGGDVEYVMGLYLIVAGPGTTISISNDWYDESFCWRPDFDVDFGAPLADAVRTGRTTWARNYTRSSVTVDTSTSSAQVMLLA